MKPSVSYGRDGVAQPRDSSEPYDAVLSGLAPAEALTTENRERVVISLVDRGMSDREIAELTRMTTYTTARIRDRLRMRANPNGQRRSPDAA